ncbi:hypothetical protein BBK82_38750 [Lentzea guizhouensis]|uniref:Ricin B lectin domain-containing protein n=1 Tax=Lentzea guizhouensis TaxID=1586287 RepID=A0A1B2HTI6_9PSEU|nr:hypothetical protein [Lentzea guizhouensis]ANZ41041.1 hypothetical protein BBK82_38750 [Lentzea guizhouensis]
MHRRYRFAALLATAFTALGLTAAPANADTAPNATTGAPGSAKSNSSIQAPALPDQLRAQAARTVCLNAHLENVGWQGWVCASDGAGALVGTTGQNRQMEALAVSSAGTGGICAQAHVADLGWLSQVCVADGDVGVVGTTGQGRQVEALGLGAPSATTCANAHLSGIGWQGASCAGPGVVAFVGTTGQNRQMEALIAGVS